MSSTLFATASTLALVGAAQGDRCLEPYFGSMNAFVSQLRSYQESSVTP